MAGHSDSNADPRSPLEHSSGRTREVAGEVKRASEDLLVINTVLEQELPEKLQVGDVAQAIEHTGELEKKLAESAQSLVEVHAALQTEIEKRKQVTAQRDASRALLDRLGAGKAPEGGTG
jgi:predicted component of type VI protein secretion system